MLDVRARFKYVIRTDTVGCRGVPHGCTVDVLARDHVRLPVVVEPVTRVTGERGRRVDLHVVRDVSLRIWWVARITAPLSVCAWDKRA